MALDKQLTSDSLFGAIKKQKELSDVNRVEIVEKDLPIQDTSTDAASLPKWKSLERLSVLLSVEQREGIGRIARQIMRNRSKHPYNKAERERITANTVIRAAIDHLLTKEGLIADCAANTEEEVREWIGKILQ